MSNFCKAKGKERVAQIGRHLVAKLIGNIEAKMAMDFVIADCGSSSMGVDQRVRILVAELREAAESGVASE